MNKIISIEKAIDMIKDGDTIMVGGFLSGGTTEPLIDALVKKGTKNLTLIASDTAFVDRGVGKLVANKQCKKIYTSHVGTNKETGRQMSTGETEVILVPQGSLAEKIRAAGYGLGGVLTPTGIGTLVEEGKQTIEVDGKKYILETPLHADFAFVHANTVDKYGNLQYRGSQNNFNNVMASAAKITFAMYDNLVEAIDPNFVHTLGIFVNYIVDGTIAK